MKFYVPAGKHTQREFPFLPSGRFYRVTDTSHDGNWPNNDPNHGRAKPYLATVPQHEGYPADLAGGKTIGQAWGMLRYRPLLAQGEFLDALAGDTTLIHSQTAPFLRPARPELGGEATFDFSSPYVLVDGLLETELTGTGVRIEIRTMAPKPAKATEPERWSPWQLLSQGPGPRKMELGRPRFNGKDISIHGTYRFQIRVTVDGEAGRVVSPGLSALSLRLYFENGIMSIPRIFAGANTIRFRLRAAADLRAPVEVVYHYETALGKTQHSRTLRPSDFKDNLASYPLDAPGLQRCNSISISY